MRKRPIQIPQPRVEGLAGTCLVGVCHFRETNFWIGKRRKITVGGRSLIGLLLLILSGAGAPSLAQEMRGMNPGETVADAAVPQNAAMAEIKDVANLPRILLIGDSISIAYTLPVRNLLQGKANVHRIPVNGTGSGAGVTGIQQWVGTGTWSVIVFNFGIHDAKIWSQDGQPALPRAAGQPATSLEKYAENLRQIIRRLRPTGARLIFATTTPIPEVTTGRWFDSIPARNAVAVQVMQSNGVAICDLYSAIFPQRKEFERPGDVHFTQAGSIVLAQSVADCIQAQLPAGRLEKDSPDRK